MAEPLLKVEHLKKYFKTATGQLHAVDDVSFSVSAGETLGVVGESGCGKSTLGRTLLHLVEPTEGKIWYDGKDISHVNRKQLHNLRKDMQIIFQDPFSSLNPRMTVRQIVAEPMEIYRMGSSSDIAKRVDYLLDTVELSQRFADSYPHEMDGGCRQRVGIARALALRPKFIVCDEPVSALDVSIQAQVLNLMMDLQDEMKLTYLFITHDLSVVKHISNYICVMYLGQIVELCPAKELFLYSIHPYTKALLSAIPIPSIDIERNRIPIQGELSSPIDPKPGCRFASRCPYAQEVCFAQTPPLREIAPNHQVACHLAESMYQEATAKTAASKQGKKED